MFIEALSDLVEFLSLRSHSLDDVLAHLTLITLAPIDCAGIIVGSLKSNGDLEVLARFGGIAEKIADRPKTLNISERHPATDSIRTRKVVWITTLPDWGPDYPDKEKLMEVENEKTLICFAIERFGTPAACMSIFCKSEVHPSVDIDTFLKAIGSILSMYMYRVIDAPQRNGNGNGKGHNGLDVSSSSLRDQKLTERQILILRLIAEGRTNVAISELLGYSESTIRQETIKIYAKLNCYGRQQAADIYRKSLIKEK